MKYKLLKQGVVVNTIVSDLPFVEKYCSENDLTFEEVEAVVPDVPDITPTEQRENAYNTDPVIEWDGEMLTVTQAATMWQYYAAEGSEKASELQTLIAAAKQNIRERFPDKEVE